MTIETSAEKACGQILICLKMSELNHMVKETPFSAYVTLGKKFLNSYQIEHEDPLRFDQDDTVSLSDPGRGVGHPQQWNN